MSSNRYKSACFSIFLAVVSAHAAGPGDGDILKGVHPGYTLKGVAPAGLNLGVSGIDFLSDGRLVVCTWAGDHKKLVPPSQKGEVYILSNTAQDDSSQVGVKKFATGLQEPLGLKVVNDTIYVSERQALAMLADKNKNGVLDAGEYSKLAAYTDGGSRHEFFFGLVYKDGYFYGAHSLSLQNGGGAAVPQPEPNRGTYLKIEKATGKTTYISGGAREPFGVGMNPEGEIFTTEVQGTWNPACAFTQMKEGRFYGHPQVNQQPANPWDSKPYQAPAVLLPETEIANAPGEPAYVPSGIFKGQYLYGDVTYGGIQRVYLEKMANGEYQGGVVRFSAGFTGGVSRLKFGPDGDLYVGQIGDPDGNWHEIGKEMYGLQKLKANGKTAFEMLRVVSRPKGVEIEFTEPVAMDAEQASKYQVKSWSYTRTAGYGGPKVNNKTLAVTKVQVNDTRKKVYLELAGMAAGNLIYIHLVGLKSSEGKAAWSTETWYTLNTVGTGDPFVVTTLEKPAAGKLAAGSLKVSRMGGAMVFRIEAGNAYALRIVNAEGALVREIKGDAAGAHSVPVRGLAPGLYGATLLSQGRTVSQAFANF